MRRKKNETIRQFAERHGKSPHEAAEYLVRRAIRRNLDAFLICTKDKEISEIINEERRSRNV